jgi:hypothetical protein
MPQHIAEASNEQVPRIPMALIEEKYGNKFWKVLMHCILPGTLLSARPAALLASLSLTLGIEPLMGAAKRELLPWRDRWNDLEIPENWNASCLSLLLDAEQVYRGRHPESPKTLLAKDDRDLFEQLIAFHILELSLHTPLTATVAWTPEKSTAPTGPLVLCQQCSYPRSVTIMNANGKCGLCLAEYHMEDREKVINARVSMGQTEKTPATWVECGMHASRAQYVVYNVEGRNVRAKCHFCRTDSQQKELSVKEGAPCVECSRCRNRMIWPSVFRPPGFVPANFVCPACQAGQKTIVNVETTAWTLCATTGDMSWLVADAESPESFPLHQHQLQSIFKVVLTYSPNGFTKRLKALPSTTDLLSLQGKVLHNSPEVKAALQDIVSRRQIGQHVCSMCFTESRIISGQLSAACGRKGCHQKTCRDCLQSWYGLNGPGQIINTAVLHCPFCRRLPQGQELGRYGRGVHAVADLRIAITERGHWIYAWCQQCGRAQPYVERPCAAGTPPEVERWECDDCREHIQLAVVEMERLRLEARAENVDEGIQRELLDRIETLGLPQVKPCPQCGVFTSKSSRCDHIECSACNTHGAGSLARSRLTWIFTST